MITKVDNFVESNLSTNEYDKGIIKARITRFLYNTDDNDKRDLLFNIVSNTKWIDNKKIMDYFIKQFKKIDEPYLIYNHKLTETGSTTFCISSLSHNGIVEDKEIINDNYFKDNPNKIIEIDNLILIDDYIGTGNTLLKAIDNIKDKIKYKKLTIICYICQEETIEKIKSKGIILFFKEVSKKYSNILDKDTCEYAESICNRCRQKDDDKEKMCFGYKNTGAMIAINQISPNNDISLMWDNTIKLNKKRWFPLFNREIGFIKWSQKNKQLIKNNSTIIREIQKNNKYNLSLKELEFLLYSFSCYYTEQEIIDNGYFSSSEEYNKFVSNMIEKGYIEEGKGYFYISDNNLYRYITSVMNQLFRDNNWYKVEISNKIAS